MIRNPRSFPIAITARPTPELAAFCTTQSPGFRSTYSLSMSAAAGGVEFVDDHSA
jgi:hypothetical protein